jgi:chemotaxis protein methyltransferase WspC
MIELKRKLVEFFENEIGLDITTIGENIFQRSLEKLLFASDWNEGQFFSAVVSKSEEYYELLGELTVSETWFMREEKALEECYDLLKKKNSRLNILSIPCSTGEEAYSILIYLIKKGIDLDRLNVYGIDINPASLELAQRGVFNEYSFRKPSLACEGCFEDLSNNRKKLLDRYRDKVVFVEGNLLDTSLEVKFPKFDAIFCRNVLIYFSENAKISALANLKQMLKKDGAILSGHSEIMLFLKNGFERKDNCSFALQPKATEPQKSEFSLPIEYFPIPKEYKCPTTYYNPIEEEGYIRRGVEGITDLANKGELEKAEAMCREFIRFHEFDHKGYYLFGLIREAQNMEAQAIEYYNKALYLNPHHYLSLVHLSLIYQANGDAKKAAQLSLRAEKSGRGGK